MPPHVLNRCVCFCVLGQILRIILHSASSSRLPLVPVADKKGSARNWRFVVLVLIFRDVFCLSIFFCLRLFYLLIYLLLIYLFFSFRPFHCPFSFQVLTAREIQKIEINVFTQKWNTRNLRVLRYSNVYGYAMLFKVFV